MDRWIGVRTLLQAGMVVWVEVVFITLVLVCVAMRVTVLMILDIKWGDPLECLGSPPRQRPAVGCHCCCRL